MRAQKIVEIESFTISEEPAEALAEAGVSKDEVRVCGALS